jgi:ABC-type cobalamin transport system permease subunit
VAYNGCRSGSSAHGINSTRPRLNTTHVWTFRHISFWYINHVLVGSSHTSHQHSLVCATQPTILYCMCSLQVTNALELSEIHTDEAGSRFESLRRLVPWEVATASLLRA